jgi:hypothetical protein
MIVWTNEAFSASILQNTVVAKATPDECFNGIGEVYQPLGSGYNESNCTNDGYKAKVNQAYVWGMAQTDNYIWFGTAPNTLCMVNGTYHGATTASENDSWVCELNSSQYSTYMAVTYQNNSYLALNAMGLGDWRTPKIYRYNKATGETNDMTPYLYNAHTPNDYNASILVLTTLGFRSAGEHDGIVFLAGPGFGGGSLSVNMFAFNGETGALLGTHVFTEYNNIRKWIVAEDNLYTAVGVSDKNESSCANGTGAILKWDGNSSDPFNFVEVGCLPGSGAELAYHEGRLFVTTWPGSELSSLSTPAGVFMSPDLPDNTGLAQSDENWTEIWNAGEYEPDRVISMTYGGGAIASFDGYLYWGTMHVPLVATLASAVAYADYNISSLDPEDVMTATNRTIAIFRADGIESNGSANIELLYGESELPAYSVQAHQYIDTTTGMTPLWGSSGFGNAFNNYTWTMNVFHNKLYIGTMDWSYLAQEYLNQDLSLFEQLFLSMQMDPGADLWRIDNTQGPAVAENITGVGNKGSYGIRTMLSDDDSLYLGMANPMNLMTNKFDFEPQGGWELIEMQEKSSSDSVTSSGGGGGCSYNPNNNKIDMLYMILFFLAIAYYGRQRSSKKDGD